MKTNIILNGDALTHLKELPNESIDCVMTSPPYWALRDYGVKGQLGLEPTFKLYIKHLCDIFDEVKRVLKKSGTCWVNLGDSYGGSGNSSGHKEDTMNLGYTTKDMGASKGNQQSTKGMEKSLVMIPFRFAIEMVNRGWILRNNIIWKKNNCMPSSAKDRFTVDFEYLFFFVKNKEYYFETQYEPHLTQEKRIGIVRNREYNYNSKLNAMNKKRYSLREKRGGDKNPDFYNSLGRNKRTVWTINPKPFKESHFAVYPEELCETPIKAGCPEFVCVKCGKAKEKIEEKEYEQLGKITENEKSKDPRQGNNFGTRRLGRARISNIINKGYISCSCNTEFTGGIVLDPFFGSGTTGLVALKQNKKFIGIELNNSYISIAKKRLKPFLEQEKLILK